LFKLNLNAGQRRGAIAIGIAFVFTALLGIGLSFLAINWDTTALFGAGFLAFILIAPLFAYGIYTYGRHSQEEVPAEDMTIPRQLLDILREQGASDIAMLSVDLGVASIKPIIDELSRLELFNGIVDWDAGTIALLEPTVIASIEKCKHCSQVIAIHRGLTICQNCGTEYHYY
jgi:hypothetical protein